MPCRLATTLATAPGRSVSRTICNFLSALHRRRRSACTLTSTRSVRALLRASYEHSSILPPPLPPRSGNVGAYRETREGGGGLTLTLCRPLVEDPASALAPVTPAALVYAAL